MPSNTVTPVTYKWLQIRYIDNTEKEVFFEYTNDENKVVEAMIRVFTGMLGKKFTKEHGIELKDKWVSYISDLLSPHTRTGHVMFHRVAFADGGDVMPLITLNKLKG